MMDAERPQLNGYNSLTTRDLLHVSKQEHVSPSLWPEWVKQATQHSPGRSAQILFDMKVWMMLDGLEEIVRNIE
jgi:hypothetical protein